MGAQISGHLTSSTLKNSLNLKNWMDFNRNLALELTTHINTARVDLGVHERGGDIPIRGKDSETD